MYTKADLINLRDRKNISKKTNIWFQLLSDNICNNYLHVDVKLQISLLLITLFCMLVIAAFQLLSIFLFLRFQRFIINSFKYTATLTCFCAQQFILICHSVICFLCKSEFSSFLFLKKCLANNCIMFLRYIICFFLCIFVSILFTI